MAMAGGSKKRESRARLLSLARAFLQAISAGPICLTERSRLLVRDGGRMIRVGPAEVEALSADGLQSSSASLELEASTGQT
jgi:hypothetical protein